MRSLRILPEHPYVRKQRYRLQSDKHWLHYVTLVLVLVIGWSSYLLTQEIPNRVEYDAIVIHEISLIGMRSPLSLL